jgi:hypothetical protein
MNIRVVTLIGAVSITVALGATACDRSTSTPSSFVSPTPVDQNATVAVTVWRHDTGGVTPDANVQLDAWVQTGNSGRRLAPTNAGPDGRYSFTVPTGALFRVRAGWLGDAPPRYQPCVTAIAAPGNTTLDVHTIVDPAQLGAHLPGELLAGTPTLSGTVFETTPLGRQPVPDVLLELDMFGGLGDVSATTLTDADGHYILCGLGGAAATAPSIGSTYIYALKSGYRLADVGAVIVNGNTIRDIEVQR